MGERGSKEYELTWRAWDTRSGPQICALRASAPRTSANAYGGWGTPTEQDAKHGDASPSELQRDPANLRLQVHTVAGWQTPKLPSGGGCERNTPGGGLRKLEDQAELLSGWPTPTTRDHKDGTAKSCENTSENALLGRVCHAAGTSAETATRGGFRLNPHFSLWLMGYPKEWGSCGVRAMRSFRRSRRSSS